MKKLLICCCVLLLAAASADARRKQPSAGYVKDGVFYDVKHEYSFEVHDNWSDRIRKNKEDFRIVLLQENYGIPADYQQAEDYTLVPRMVVYVAETNMGPGQFVDSLLSPSYDSDQKGEIRREFDMLNKMDIIPKGRQRLTIDGYRTDFWSGEAPYAQNISTSASGVGGKRVNRSYMGSIIAVKKENKMLLFHIMSEKEFFNQVSTEATSMVNTLNWGGESDEDSGDEGKS
ncbi:hypothetical protein GF420_11960 [candidate division GN15 bacterium]|nr:hypothetical protein [candidate division GN15 bacterium]